MPSSGEKGGDSWLHGFNTYMSEMRINAFTQPARQIFVIDLGNEGRWISGSILSGAKGTTGGDQLRYNHPRPHGGGSRVNVGFLDGHVAASRVSELTRAMVRRDTSAYVAADETTLILNPADDHP